MQHNLLNPDPGPQSVGCFVFVAAIAFVIFNSSSRYINSYLKAVCCVPCDRHTQSLLQIVLMPLCVWGFISVQHPDSHFLLLTNTQLQLFFSRLNPRYFSGSDSQQASFNPELFFFFLFSAYGELLVWSMSSWQPHSTTASSAANTRRSRPVQPVI